MLSDEIWAIEREHRRRLEAEVRARRLARESEPRPSEVVLSVPAPEKAECCNPQAA